jgi:hypothetical protein
MVQTKEAAMTRTARWKSKHALVALPLLLAGIVLAAPAAEARVGIGLSVPLIVPPPAMVAPPVVVAPPAVVPAPPVVLGPPPYYALPPGYYYAPPPAYGYVWYDRFGRRHWAH